MSTDEDGRKASSSSSSSGTTSNLPPAGSSTFRIPAPLKRVFDRFPLYTYPSNSLPLSVPRTKQHVLYIFTTSREAQSGAPSFNPTCLKWQTYLRFHDIAFQTVPSNNHASPSGALPFLLPMQTTASGPSPVTTSSLSPWIRKQVHFGPSHHDESAQTQTYHSLVMNTIRLAYLYALYVDPYTSGNVAAPLYIHPSTSSALVRQALIYPLRKAAWEEIMTGTYAEGTAAGSIDAESLLERAQEAFEALESRLGSNKWFSQANPAELYAAGPHLIDALVFSYTHVILEYFADEEPESPAGKLAAMLRGRDALVAHRDRVLGEYYQSDWRDQ